MGADAGRESDDWSVRKGLLLCRRAAAALAAANGHRIGRFDHRRRAVCDHCGAALVESDAVAFVECASALYLGSLSAPCPGSWADR